MVIPSIQLEKHTKRKERINSVINFIFEHVTPSSLSLFTYRVGDQGFHVLRLNEELEITLLDGMEDIPNKSLCLKGLQEGGLRIGVLDSVDITYTITRLTALCQTQSKSNHFT